MVETWEVRLSSNQVDMIETVAYGLAEGIIEDDEALERFIDAGLTAEEAEEYINAIIEGPEGTRFA